MGDVVHLFQAPGRRAAIHVRLPDPGKVLLVFEPIAGETEEVDLDESVALDLASKIIIAVRDRAKGG